MTTRNLSDLDESQDPFTLFGKTDDGAWEFTARFVASPTGLKMWALTIAPNGLRAEDQPPQDAPGVGINTGVLKKIRFPQIRDLMKRQADEHLGRVLEQLDRATPEDRKLLETEHQRAQREASRSKPAQKRSQGRPSADDGERGQWALDVLESKDLHGYRQVLRQSWSKREGRHLKVKTVDTRMRRLRDEGWLTGYGKVASPGPRLGPWLEERSGAQQPAEKE